MFPHQIPILFTLFSLINVYYSIEECSDNFGSVDSSIKTRYTRDLNEKHSAYLQTIENAFENYEPCLNTNCKCHLDVIDADLQPFQDRGITKDMLNIARTKGTAYQIISNKLYRQKECHFPARCAGIEHYLGGLLEKLPDLEMVVNTRDWPQLNRNWQGNIVPVFSFSKTKEYLDIMYPAWSFWEGGPAISLYPTGLGRWHEHRKTLNSASDRWPWDEKKPIAFFRGSRTSQERDPIVLLSREMPHLVDAAYTKNQAWKSEADTLHAPPAKEIPLEDHCKYKYLFNFRGVAASFRFKHLFLCKSLVFHVGDEWLEFFYPALKPWVHYVPVSPKSTKEDLRNLIEFFKDHDHLAKKIADNGREHVWKNLREKDVKCYWLKLLTNYSKLLKYKIERDETFINIR